MLKYLAGRIVGMLPAVFLLVFFVVVLIQLIPGNIIDLMLDQWPELSSCWQELQLGVSRKRMIFEPFREEDEPASDSAIEKENSPAIVLFTLPP